MMKFIYNFLILVLDCRIVHMHGFTKKNIFLIFLAKFLMKKTILKLSSYGYDDVQSLKKKSILNWIAIKLVERIICTTPAFFNNAIKAGINEKKLVLIPNFIDLDYKKIDFNKNIIFFKKIKDKKIPKIISIGYFSDDKNPLLIFNAWLDNYLKGNKSYLIFIGQTRLPHIEVNPKIKTYMMLKLKKYNLLKQVLFVEKTSNINQFLYNSDIYVSASKREGLSNSLLEAMSMKCICLVSKIPGTDEVINNKRNGYIFNHKTGTAIYKKLQYLIKNYKKLSKVKNRANDTIQKKFEMKKNLKKLSNLYDQY